ncbi:hypothetical protein FD754_015469 [Muntiacus muntjak]|uniref:BTB domain-containing protein n=1 Tax=Muntiacus muntjak TaxID=9888 RepID=A0A5N3VN47_MUNMU|nr:hypothetical protein FD754_015469 [Muntiacus muntjak]
MDLTKMGMIQLQNPSHPTGLLCKANQMRLAGTLCDVVIMVDSQEFHAHRTVLACTSKMFEILFHRNSQHYTLDFLSPKTFQQILEYAYTATLQAKAEDLDDLLYAAEILEIEYLEEQCLKILETIQASDDNDTEATMAEGGAEEEEDRKARYLKNIFISKHSSEESGYASVAAQSLPGPLVDQSPSVSTSFGLSAMSPTKAAVDSLMTIGQSLLQGALQPPAGPEEPTLAGGGRHPAVAEVKPEMMQVDEVPGQESPGAAESSISAGMGDKVEERGKEGPGTPTRSSVITSARELHYGREESAEQLPPPVEAGQGPPGRLEPPAPPAEKHLGLYPVLPNHKADAVLSMPSSVTSGLHVQPTLAVSMDFSTYGGLLPQGFIQRELFSKLGELAVGMKAESRTVGEQCSVCGVELPDNEAVEQHSFSLSPVITFPCTLSCLLCCRSWVDSSVLHSSPCCPPHSFVDHSGGETDRGCVCFCSHFPKEETLSPNLTRYWAAATPEAGAWGCALGGKLWGPRRSAMERIDATWVNQVGLTCLKDKEGSQNNQRACWISRSVSRQMQEQNLWISCRQTLESALCVLHTHGRSSCLVLAGMLRNPRGGPSPVSALRSSEAPQAKSRAHDHVTEPSGSAWPLPWPLSDGQLHGFQWLTM